MALKINNDTKIKAKPFLKWVGGKTQMLDVLHESMPKKYNKYIEAFVGGGAMYFSLSANQSVISDINEDLVNAYRVVKNDVESLIEILRNFVNTEEEFYRIRSLDTTQLSDVERAARLIYLNKTCFNGLYRVNKKGQFNTPYGKYKNPNICNAENLRTASNHLKDTTIVLGDYLDVLKEYAEPGDLVFLDPPYIPIGEYSDFNRYTKEKFYDKNQIELANEVKRLHELGCYVILTNSDHELVHELYRDYEIEVHNTKRFINSDANKRTGRDALVKVLPKKLHQIESLKVPINPRYQLYPSTRYMGSKAKLLEHIWDIASSFDFDSVLDLFSGSGAVSYMFKTQGKKVISNDYMTFTSNLTKAVVENNHTILTDKDLELLLNKGVKVDNFVKKTFEGLYFRDSDNEFIDVFRANVIKLSNQYKKALAHAAMSRACMKRRPRGIFAYVGFKYNDGRKDLTLTLEEHFIKAIGEFNASVFDNGQKNMSKSMDSLKCHSKADLVYLDPPYYSTRSDNEYVRRYHFVEGIARDWQDVEMQWDTKTKKFKSYPSAFSTYQGAYDAFDMLFKRHRKSILMLSYSSNSLPNKQEILDLMRKYKKYVDVVEIDYKYSFANQGHAVNNNKNDVKEYIFIGY